MTEAPKVVRFIYRWQIIRSARNNLVFSYIILVIVIQEKMCIRDREGITILHITHFMDEAVHADRVIVMEEGEIVLEGTPRDIFSKVEELKRIGLDVPQVTEIAYQLKKAGLSLSLIHI